MLSPEESLERDRKTSGNKDGISSQTGSGTNINVLYQGKAEESGSKEELIPNHVRRESRVEEEHTARIKKRLKDNLKTKHIMSEKEFEEILKLCEVSKTFKILLQLSKSEK